MRIKVNDPEKKISSSCVEQTKNRIEAALSKFGLNVTSAELSIESLNVPKGGLDKGCRILVRLRKMSDVVVSVNEATFSKAISRAINRAERAVGRKIQRRSLRDPGRRSEFRFVFYN